MEFMFEQRCVVVLAGPSGIGKSTLGGRLFPGMTLVSSDAWRGMLFDDEGDQSDHQLTFEMVHAHVRARLRAGRPAVVDATALTAKERRAYVEIADEAGVPAHLVVLKGSREECLAGWRRRAAGGGRPVFDALEKVVERHVARLDGLLRDIDKGRVAAEGFSSVRVLDREQAAGVAPAQLVSRVAAKVDVIGDVHGCVAELQLLLGELGYEFRDGTYIHPQGRVAAFLGDFTDRGPASVAVIELVLGMVRARSGFVAAMGNHDWKLYRWLVLERDVKVAHGLETTVREIEAEDARVPGRKAQIRDMVRELLADAPAYSDLGGLVLTHGAMPAWGLGRACNPKSRSELSGLCMYGQTDGERPDGLPNRVYEWVSSWVDRDEVVIIGHDVVGFEPRTLDADGRVIGLDTGCAFGGRLSAYRWPEREIVQVDAVAPGSRGHEALGNLAAA